MNYLPLRKLAPHYLYIHPCHSLNPFSLMLGPALCCPKACAHEALLRTLVCVTACLQSVAKERACKCPQNSLLYIPQSCGLQSLCLYGRLY